MEDFSSSNAPGKKPTDQDQVTQNLRISLWNLIYPLFNENINHPIAGYDISKWSENVKTVVHKCWADFFKLSIDTIPSDATACLRDIKEKFFNLSLINTYNFLEFLANKFESHQGDLFRKNCNKIFQQENVDYRFVEKKVFKITSIHEAQSIEEAQKTPYMEVNSHIEAAVRLLSDKSHPDYRNSIKESISAIEALVKIVQGNSKKTLSELLKQKNLNLHTALQEGLNKIYGYTSDESGVRHALTNDGREVTRADALFMVIICSAFVNYIIQKQAA